MAEPIGALRVGLSANAAQFERDMGKARSSVRKSSRSMRANLDRFRTSVSNTIKSVFSFRSALVAVAGATGLALLVKRSIAAADAVGKTADKIGVGVEALQEYRHAAEIAGVQSNTLDMALQRFSRRFGEAAANTGELKSVLDEYGISTQRADGSTKSLEEALSEYADVLQNASNDQERLRLAFKAFDSEGAALVNMLRRGSAGLDQMRQEARDLGLVLGEDMVRDAEKANDELTRMGATLRTQMTQTLIALSPQIIRLGEAFKEIVPEIIALSNAFLPDRFLPVESLREKIDSLEKEFTDLTGVAVNQAALVADAFRDDIFPPEQKERIKAVTRELIVLDDILKERIRKDELLRASITATGSEEQKLIAAIGRVSESLQFEIDQLGRTETQQELYSIAKKEGVEVNKAFTDSILPMLEALESERKAQKEATEAAEEAARKQEELAQEGRAVYDATRTALEQYNAEIERLNVLLNSGAISGETFARGMQQAKEQLDDTDQSLRTNTDLTRDLGLTFTSAFEEAITAGGELSDVLHGLQQDLIRLAPRRFITEPLLGAFDGLLSGFGGSAPFEPVPGVTGPKPQGFASGGSFVVGGPSGIDRTPVRFNATRGERVTIETPAQQAAADARGAVMVGGGDVTVNVHAPPGSSVDQRETAGPGGRTIDVVIDDTVAKLVGTPGSRTTRAMQHTFSGLNKQLEGR